ncbi:MAG: hypothetical protein KJ811_00135, partial [Candidatus Margulisbacteria bacterium]|nr:hypothetical protein [Candidatus Margulisiibacteriota bacterium]
MKKYVLLLIMIVSSFLITGCQTAQNEASSVEETTSTTATPASTTTTSTTSTTSTSTSTTTTSTTSTTSTSTSTTTTVPSGSVIIKGNINKVEDYFGNADFYGEIINNSGGNVSFVEITITMKNASGSVIDTDSTFINGTVLILNSSGIDTGSCLRPGEYGAFWVNTSTDFSDVASYEYDLDWNTHAASNPSASLEVI